MKDLTFDQAQALIKRVGEHAGGSADAYEVDLGPAVGPLPNNTPGLGDPSPRIDEDDVGCLEGVVDWEEVGERIWTNPPLISDDYRLQGVVEDAECAELMIIYEGFLQARNENQPQTVQLDTGAYQITRAANEGRWQLHDTAKDLLYLQDHPVENGVVSASDMFIWVQTFEPPSRMLGYIHLGYVMICA